MEITYTIILEHFSKVIPLYSAGHEHVNDNEDDGQFAARAM